MPCDSKPFTPNQTLAERKQQVLRAVEALSKALVNGRARAIVGAQGAITFTDWEDRAGVSDSCAYRKIMVSGSTLAKAAIARAEQLAGRSVDRDVIAHGVHSHDGGRTWHDPKG